jgi:hypothetical protein
MRLRLAGLLIGLSTLGFAGTWSGFLVSSACYQSEMNNVSQDDAMATNRDMNMVLRQCAATHKTTKFAIVQNDWTARRLDAAGNERAAAIVRNSRRPLPLYCITVHGVRRKDMIVTGPVAIASVRRRR